MNIRFGLSVVVLVFAFVVSGIDSGAAWAQPGIPGGGGGYGGGGFGGGRPSVPSSSFGGRSAYTPPRPPSIPSPNYGSTPYGGRANGGLPNINNGFPNANRGMPNVPSTPQWETVYECSNCGREVGAATQRCPGCGVSFSGTSSRSGSGYRGSSRGIGKLFGFAVFAIVAGVSYLVRKLQQ